VLYAIGPIQKIFSSALFLSVGSAFKRVPKNKKYKIYNKISYGTYLR
jgi:hypothetical protein